MFVDKKTITRNVTAALTEDVHTGDITAELIAADTQAQATIFAREAMVLCGCDWADEAIRQVDPEIIIDWHYEDADHINQQSIARLAGPARSLLTVERTLLNFLQTLSATATLTRAYVERIQHTHCQILDTRKTIPGLRVAQKYAVHCGGGTNHRQGLFDAFLIKENHIAACGSITSAIQQARELYPKVLLEVEVEDRLQLEEALSLSPDRILLDNFTLPQLTEAVELTASRVRLEASGNMTLDTIEAVAETGVDFISIGGLTKHVQAVDLSMRFVD